MNLVMNHQLGGAYRSNSQRARVITEAWGEQNLYCANCTAAHLSRLRNNTRVFDYRCPACGFDYQLKAQQSRIAKTLSDGAYQSMLDAIRQDAAPNVFILQYDRGAWCVRNLLLIPRFAFPESAIIKRNPLSSTARRAGWIGCNIALNRIPLDARIAVVQEGSVISSNQVRARYRLIKRLQIVKPKQRGWTLDVLNSVRRLGKEQFRTADMYAYVRELEELHPDNRHVKDKIRQQLQILRDQGFLEQVERGVWRCLELSSG